MKRKRLAKIERQIIIITEKRDELKNDSRLKSPTATIDINAPLALTQLEILTQIQTLSWVLKLLDEEG